MKKTTKDTSYKSKTKDLSFEGRKKPFIAPYYPVGAAGQNPADWLKPERDTAPFTTSLSKKPDVRHKGGRGVDSASRKTKARRKDVKNAASAAVLAERKAKGRRKELKNATSAAVLSDRKSISGHRGNRNTFGKGTAVDKKPKIKLKAGSCDFIYAAVVVALVIFGVVMVFSASSYTALKENDDSLLYFIKECKFALVGVLVMLVAAFVPMKLIIRSTPLVSIVSFVLLLLLFTPLAVVRNDSARWIGVGDYTIMPGEIAKLAAILFVAMFLSSRPEKIRSLFKGVIPLLLYCGVNFYLIYKEPSLATAITLAAIVLGMMFVAGMNLIYVGGALGAASVGLFYLIVSDETGYHFRRMVSFLDPFEAAQGDGYQVVQSLLGLGAGGVFGVGLGNSIQKALYLPEGHNDFILAIIGEELGFVGCLVLLLAYMVLIFRGTWIAIKAPDRFSMLTAAGITIMFAVQVIMNVLVVTSWMPPTGVILPFVSYGGNSLILYLAEAGVMLNISRRINAEEVQGTGGTEIYSVRTNIRERKPEVRLAGAGNRR